MTQMSDLINIVKQPNGEFIVYYNNGAKLGELYQDAGGEIVFEANHHGQSLSSQSFWTAEVLRAIADKLDELNGPLWDAQGGGTKQ